jgi:diguanylate cyclase (GGDEF)-like protein
MGFRNLKDMLGTMHFNGRRQGTQLALTLAEQEEVIFRIERINALRLKLIGYTAIVLELLLILFIDLPNLSKPTPPTASNWAYLFAHLFLLTISIAVVIVEQVLFSEKNRADFKQYAWISGAFGMLFLSAVAFITGLDQQVNDQIVSFIAMFAAGSMVYYCKPPRQLYVLGIPVVIFVACILYFQQNSAIASANIINGLMFAVTMMVISISNYNKATSEISKELLLEARTEKLDFLAHHDPLTGLYNRRSFEHEVLKLSAEDNQQRHFVLGIMDLDYFKRINDVFGHDKADEVLIIVADIMKRGIEPSGIVARWGGEEFIFMLYGLSFEALKAQVESLRESIASEIIVIADQTIAVTGSFGLTEVHYESLNQLKEKFSLVDSALYESKDAGRNRVTVRI